MVGGYPYSIRPEMKDRIISDLLSIILGGFAGSRHFSVSWMWRAISRHIHPAISHVHLLPPSFNVGRCRWLTYWHPHQSSNATYPMIIRCKITPQLPVAQPPRPYGASHCIICSIQVCWCSHNTGVHPILDPPSLSQLCHATHLLGLSIGFGFVTRSSFRLRPCLPFLGPHKISASPTRGSLLICRLMTSSSP